MSYRIFVTGSGLADAPRLRLVERGCTVETGNPTDTAPDLAARLADFHPDGLIVRQGRIDDSVLGAAPGLRVVCKHGVGTDNIDVEAAARRGIPVLYTPGANYESVAQHTLALLLGLARGIAIEDRRVRRGSFDKTRYRGVDLGGRTLGLIGWGRVARRVAELVAPLGMNVLVFHPSSPSGEFASHVSRTRSPACVLESSDFVSLHCPLTETTRHMIGAEALSAMKPGSFLINTARGGLVDEGALHDALSRGHLAGAGLDVFEQEPPDRDHPLLELENVICSPHVGGASDTALDRMGFEAARNVLAVLDGEPVDPESMVEGSVTRG